MSSEHSKGTVYCHKCGGKTIIDTIACVNNDKWPVCCGSYMEVDTELDRRKERRDRAFYAHQKVNGS